MERRNARGVGLIMFGIILLVIGLGASFYHINQPYRPDYPFLNTFLGVGIVLAVVGIVFMTLGFFYPSHKTPPSSNPQQQKTH